MEKRLLTEIANDIGNDNKSVDELIDRIMKNVEKWAKEHKGELKKLTPEQRERLTQPTYLVRQIAEIEYAKENLRKIVYRNLKRAQGNLGEEERMFGLYDTLEKFNYSCPYSDTLLIGGEQPIHIDHIIPVTMGGPTDDWNCIPVCGSCNDSKNNRHLLDWWQDNRMVEEEYKLVRIFEHMTSKLLDNSNQIRYLKTEDNTKHLDVITFLKQLLDHIEQNKQYILGPNTSILDDNTKEIKRKLEELKKTFERVVKKNSDKTLKTDKQYFKEQKQMLKYVKSLGVSDYYKIAYTYFNEIQEMLNNGTSEEEIRQFCFDRDNSFNFILFYEKLIEYKEKNGSFAGVRTDKEIGVSVGSVRAAYKWKRGVKLTQEMIDKLNDINFPWEVAIEDRYKDWFTPFYEKLIEYKKSNNGSFYCVTKDNEIGSTVRHVRQAYKGKGTIKLTQEMIDKLNVIDFPWEREDWFTSFYERLKEYKRKHGNFDGATNNKEIGGTIGSIRKAYKGKGTMKLTSEMIDKLNAIGFPWESEKVDWFTQFYDKLIDYKDKNGNFVNVITDKEIGRTVGSVRQAFKGKGTYKLTQEMIDKLNAIGFPWEAEKRDWFTLFYEKLINYRDMEILDEKGNIRKEGYSFFGVIKDKEIGTTVNRIRQAYKGKGTIKLTQEMINKLNAIGFPWEVEKSDWFTPFYEKLIEYNEKYVSFAGLTTDKEIGQIVQNVRRAYKYKDDETKKGLYRLTQEMIDKLNAIGFPWEARAKKVQEESLSV